MYTIRYECHRRTVHRGLGGPGPPQFFKNLQTGPLSFLKICRRAPPVFKKFVFHRTLMGMTDLQLQSPSGAPRLRISFKHLVPQRCLNVHLRKRMPITSESFLELRELVPNDSQLQRGSFSQRCLLTVSRRPLCRIFQK